MTRRASIYPLNRLALLAMLTLFVMSGCDSTDPSGDDDISVSVVVANQGNFSDGNGSITGYDPETGEVSTLLSSPNSIIQSFTAHGSTLYVAMNTGDRIDVIDPERGLVGQITDVPSPRYLAWTDADLLLASNLFENSVSVIDPEEGLLVDVIDVGPNPEGILVHNSEAYVSNHGFGSGSTLSVVDLVSRTVVRTIDLDCDGPRFSFMDHGGDLWVTCTGQVLYDDQFNVTGSTDGAVLVIDAATGTELKRFDVDGMISTPAPGQDAFYSEDTGALFVVVDAEYILRFDTDGDRLVGSIGPVEGAPIGSVAYDPVSERLYVGQVTGFTTAGQVTVLSLDGERLNRFAAGVAPSHISIIRSDA